MPHRSASRPTPRSTAGVFSSDAAQGEVALVMLNSAGQRIVRLEMSERYYSPMVAKRLEQWLEYIEREGELPPDPPAPPRRELKILS